ncbi:MAG: DUF1634 domain-containing protein [bacterium]
MPPTEEQNIKVVERWSARTLQVGIWTSAILIALGLVLSFVPGDASQGSAQQQMVYDGLSSIKQNAGSPVVLLYLGLILLMLTPVLRVVTSLVGFASEKDKTYVGVSAFVLVVLLAELCYSLIIR